MRPLPIEQRATSRLIRIGAHRVPATLTIPGGASTRETQEVSGAVGRVRRPDPRTVDGMP